MSFQYQAIHGTLSFMLIAMWLTGTSMATEAAETSEIFRRVSSHQFHPLNEEGTFTLDRSLKKHGVADLTE